MKKLNKYLLENHPQVWNTKLVWVTIALFIIHVLFYLAGIGHFDTYERLHTYLDSKIHVTDEYSMSFSILTGMLFIIIWLVFYLRNNPFKSYYPLRRGYFFTEFCIQFLIFLSALTFYKSYSYGFWNTVEKRTADVDLKEELRIINLSHAFIPTHDSYSIRHCCDSVDYIDSIESVIEDTATSGIMREYLDAIKDSFYQARNRDHHYSFLNYCEKYEYYDFDSNTTRYDISRTIQRWLLDGRKDSVRYVLKRLETMSNRYKVAYNIYIPGYADTVFARKDFSFSTSVGERYDYYSYDDRTSEPVEKADLPVAIVGENAAGKIKAYYSFDDLTKTIKGIHLSRTREFELEFWLINCGFAFGFTLLLFTFRLTAIKTWFIGLVGAGVLMIACGLYAAMVRAEVGIYISYILLILFFYGLYWFFRNGGRKILSGVNLIWFTWSLPLLFALIHNLLLENYRPESYYDKVTDKWVYPESPVYDFLKDYDTELFTAYFIVCFLVVSTLLYRHFRQWKAMPEE